MDGGRDPFAVLEFGRFKVVPHRRELLADGKPITLGGRAFDTLLALIDAGGTVIDKDELMRRVWPEESSRRTIFRLRSPRCARRSVPTAI